jgi:hypothetical protein
MNDLLDLPTIDTAALALPAPAAPQTMAELATKPLALMEPTLLALAERYRDVAFDLKTPKGLAAMKAARLDLRENGRYAVQRATAEFKAQANAAKRAVDDLADRLVGIVRPQEDEFTRAIDAREAELEAEKAERARLEAERVAKLQAGIATIRGYVQLAAGLPAERIAKGIAGLEAMAFAPEAWQEFAAQATAARDESLAALRLMHAAAVQAEADKAAREALEAEAARLRAEAAERERIEAARVEEERQARQLEEDARVAALAAQQEADLAAESVRVAAAPVSEPLAIVKATAEPGTETYIADNGVRFIRRASTNTPITTPDGIVADASTGEVLQAPAQPALQTITVAAPAEEPPMSLGDICERLGFKLSEAFVRDTLGITPMESKGRAVLIAAADWPRLKAALVKHIGAA